MLVVCLLCFQELLIAQLIQGRVVNKDDHPVIGASIIDKYTNEGTVTDANGYFSLNVAIDDTLMISHVGFKSCEVVVSNYDGLLIKLVTTPEHLSEVVIVGYGSTLKMLHSGATASADMSIMQRLPAARLDEVLVGQMAGVHVRSTESEAGSAPTVRVRGTGSILASSDPIVIVDGLIVSNDFLGSIDPYSIQSLTALKDASSVAIYGSRGSNGVIQITTKLGTSAKPTFSYIGSFGIKEAYKSDAYYFSVAESASNELANSGELSERTRYKQLIGIDRDWQDVIFDEGNIIQHSFCASGGTDHTTFSASMGILKDQGVLLTDDFNRYTLDIKYKTKLSKKIEIGASVAPSFVNRRRFDGSTHDILRQPPWLPIYHDEHTIQFVNRYKYPEVQVGDYAVQRHFDDYDLETQQSVASGGLDISNSSNINPAANILERDRNEYKFKIYGNAYAALKINNYFRFKSRLAVDYQDSDFSRWHGILSHKNGASNAFLDLKSFNRYHWTMDNYLSYTWRDRNHNVNAIFGMSIEHFGNKTSSIRGSGYTSDFIRTISAATKISNAESSVYSSRFFSYFSRMSYIYGDKYLASFSLRRDGSSIFGASNQFGNFPACSVGWIISKENFLENSAVVQYLKLRISYGVTGNNQLRTGDSVLDHYPAHALLNPTSAVIDGQISTAYTANNIANPHLKWEQSKEWNIGLDFTLFNHFLSGSLDAYHRFSDQLLLNNSISSTTGFSTALVNLGSLKNSGIELELTSSFIDTKHLKWNTKIIVSKNRNELLEFGDGNGQILSIDDKRPSEWINLVGQPISSFYGWVVDKDIPQEYIKEPYHPIGGQARSVYVKDLNEDGVIDEGDKTILGDPYPDIEWSLSNSFSLGSFDISFMFQGSHGAKVRNIGDQYLYNHFHSSQEHDPKTTPRQEFIKQKIFTDNIIQDASYVSLRNLSIGYDFPIRTRSLTNRDFSLKVYVSGLNLLYFMASDYTGFNPEYITRTSPITYGYQRAGSPIYRTISLGTRLEF